MADIVLRPISQYTLGVPLTTRGSFPSQCYSIVPSGSTLAFESPPAPWSETTQTFSSSITVYAQHVNGYNYLSTSSSSSTSSTSSTSGTTSTTSQTGTGTGAPAGAKANGGGISGGAKAGIAIGVVLAVALVAIGFWFLARRRRSQAGAFGGEKLAVPPGPFGMHSTVVQAPSPTYEMYSGPPKTAVPELPTQY